MKFILRKRFKLFLLIVFLSIGFFISINLYINKSSEAYIYNDISKIPYAYTALVPGSLVYSDSSLSLIVRDRVDKAIELYQTGKVKRILLSGDHGRKNYDEVNCMKKYLLDKGIPEADIFTDHAGFDTYSSVVRADKVFCVKEMIIVSQKYHLSRALYIAHKKGFTSVYGFVADKRKYSGMRMFKIREYMANIKAFFYILVNKKPHFLGSKIPINGDSKKSYD